MSEHGDLATPPDFDALLIIPEENGTLRNLEQVRNAIRVRGGTLTEQVITGLLVFPGANGHATRPPYSLTTELTCRGGW